jgi:hypothetical protein
MFGAWEKDMTNGSKLKPLSWAQVSVYAWQIFCWGFPFG